VSRISSIILAICAAVASGYGQTAASPSKSAPAGTAGRAVPAAVNGVSKPATGDQDRRIEAAIRTKLAKSKIGEDGFIFRVHDGVVTWEGSTAVAQHKGAATRMAKTAGAVAVVNNIRVNGADTPGASEPHRARIKSPNVQKR
jgi:osmotically-inducible protein OsmY